MNENMNKLLDYGGVAATAAYCLYDSFIQNNGDMLSVARDMDVLCLVGSMAFGFAALQTIGKPAQFARNICCFALTASMILTDKLERVMQSGFYYGQPKTEQTKPK